MTEPGAPTDVGTASGDRARRAPADAGADRVEAARRSLRPMIIDSIGGWRGMVDSGLPVVVFVAANAIAGLGAGIWSALAAGAVLFLVRLLRRQSPQQAVGGLFAVAVAAFIAWRMGEARGYFLLGIWRNAIYGAVFGVSVLVRRPLVGVIWEFIDPSDRDPSDRDPSDRDPSDGDPSDRPWREDSRLRRAYLATTLMWVGVFAARVLVQRVFYNRHETGWLGVTSLVMGYPLYAVALGATFLIVRRAKRARHAA